MIAISETRSERDISTTGVVIAIVFTLIAVGFCYLYYYFLNKEYGPRRHHLQKKGHRAIMRTLLIFTGVVLVSAIAVILTFFLKSYTPLIVLLAIGGLMAISGVAFESYGSLQYELDLVKALHGDEGADMAKKNQGNDDMKDKAMLKAKLTPLQYEVTQLNQTEPPFKNKYYEHFEKGIYVDIVSGEALFSSLEKYECDCGWPSFKASINSDAIIKKEDNSENMKRIEVRSKVADSHLGHVFSDGPGPTKERYCINSAAIEFIAYEEMKKDSRYENYLQIFQKLKQDDQG